MVSDRYPHSFHDDLASSDMAVDYVRKTALDQLAEQIGAEDHVSTSNSAYPIMRRAIGKTLKISGMSAEEALMKLTALQEEGE